MGSRGDSRAAQLRVWLNEHKPERIGDTELQQIRAALNPVSDNYLRRLLRSCEVPLDPLIEGVVQDNIEALARTLLTLATAYEAGDVNMRRRVRELVLTAKEHCRWGARRLREDRDREEKREALLWMNTWLENPPVFSEWLAVRRRSTRAGPASEP